LAGGVPFLYAVLYARQNAPSTGADSFSDPALGGDGMGSIAWSGHAILFQQVNSDLEIYSRKELAKLGERVGPLRANRFEDNSTRNHQLNLGSGSGIARQSQRRGLVPLVKGRRIAVTSTQLS
jgi:hypothetical protein